MFQSVLSSEPN